MNTDTSASALLQLVQSPELQQWVENNLAAIKLGGGIFAYVPCRRFGGKGGPVLKIDPLAYPGESDHERPWIQVGMSEPGRGLDTVRAGFPIETLELDHQHALLDKFFEVAGRLTAGDKHLVALREQLQVAHP
jgi:hypothetical protein